MNQTVLFTIMAITFIFLALYTLTILGLGIYSLVYLFNTRCNCKKNETLRIILIISMIIALITGILYYSVNNAFNVGLNTLAIILILVCGFMYLHNLKDCECNSSVLNGSTVFNAYLWLIITFGILAVLVYFIYMLFFLGAIVN